jgi:nitrate reductase NapE component
VYIAFGIYITFEIFNQTTEEMKRQTTLKITDRSLLGNLKLIYENYDKCPNFCSSLFFSWQQPKSKAETTKEDDWQTVLMLSFNIFQAFEDILTVSQVDQTGIYVWIANFIPWCRSKKLKEQWDILYPNFALRTVEFGNFLFRNCLDQPEPKDSKVITNVQFRRIPIYFEA